MSKNEKKIVQDFKASGFIVELNISLPSFTKQDRRVRDELAAMKDASPEVVNVSKKLLGTDPTYLALCKKAGELRSYFRNSTLETNERGRRFLSGHYHGEFAAKMDVLINQCRALERDLRANWENAKNTAKHQLGQLAEELGECPEMHFGYDTKVIQSGEDFFTMPTAIVPKEMAMELAKKAEARVLKQYEAAHKDLYAKLLAVAERAKEGLGKDENGENKRFTATLVTDLAEIGKLGVALNVFDDPELSEIASEMRKLGENVTAEQLRKDSEVREKAEAVADDLVKKLAAKSAAFFGAGN